MRIHVPKEWELSESEVTPETTYAGRDRRAFLKTAGLGLAGAFFLGQKGLAATAGFPPAINPAYGAGGLKVTPYDLITSYNNFYEFGMDKGDPVVNANAGWNPEPWTIEIGGLAGNLGKWDVNALITKLGGIEQRVYRHRCVEAWSMVIPWNGFPLAKLIDFAQPKAEAKYVRFTSFIDPKHASGQRDSGFGWPYLEGLQLDEARNELAFMATGIYGKPIPNQNGAPIRLVTPWKYGFKGIKSIVRLDFTTRAPMNTWQRLAADEYGFYGNVNPTVDHPRWSQASEKIIGGGGFFGARQPTLMYNGYEKQVAALYQGMDPKKLY
jgi:methionine sulfoxide reductase catalytic subunit